MSKRNVVHVEIPAANVEGAKQFDDITLLAMRRVKHE